MTLNKREQLIAWVLGGVLGLGVVYYGGITWWDARAKLDQNIRKLQNQISEEKNLHERAARVSAELANWKIQTIDVGRPDPSRTDALVRNAYYNAGLTVTGWAGAGLRPSTGTRDFQESKYTATATTTTARLARFLQTIENAPLPARIDSITITTPKQGQDNLHVELTVSALLFAPRITTTAQGSNTRASTASQPATTTTRGGATRRGAGGATTVAGPTAAEQAKLEQQLRDKRAAEEARLATMPKTPEPATATGPVKTVEEIEAEMKARRAQQDEAAGSQPETPATAPAPQRTPEEIEAEMKAKRQQEDAAAAGSRPATTTSPATTGGIQ